MFAPSSQPMKTSCIIMASLTNGPLCGMDADGKDLLRFDQISRARSSCSPLFFSFFHALVMADSLQQKSTLTT